MKGMCQPSATSARGHRRDHLPRHQPQHGPCPERAPARCAPHICGAGWAATIRRVHASTAASPSVSHSRATIGPAKRTLATQQTPSGRRLAVPTSRPPPLAATGSFGLTCRTATGITGLRCGASCTFILSLQRHGRKKDYIYSPFFNI